MTGCFGSSSISDRMRGEMYVDRAVKRFQFLALGQAHQLIARQHAARVFRSANSNENWCPVSALVAVPGSPMGAAINGKSPEAQYVTIGMVAARATSICSTRYGAQSRQQFCVAPISAGSRRRPVRARPHGHGVTAGGESTRAATKSVTGTQEIEAVSVRHHVE